MVFFCQRNCYCSKLTSMVISCVPSKMEIEVDGKKTKVSCYEVIFEDTVFFPEGGGQPYDKGNVNGIPVVKVLRKGGEAIHFLLDALEVGSKVSQEIDWERRHDHMQQHSAQHLISAILERDYHLPTISWNLGEKISYIELDLPKLNENQLVQLEDTVNEAIRKHLPVSVEELDASDAKLRAAHTRGLPSDIVGPIRVVTIENIDTNMCCGTHVNNLADIQCVKILNCEIGKGGRIFLQFVAGKRTLQYLGVCVAREKELTLLLHSNSNEHVRLVEKNKKDLKRYQKSLSEAFRDLASAEAFKFNHTHPKPKFYFHHRRDGDLDYLNAIISEFNDETVLKILTAGEETGPGILVVHGCLADVDAVSRGLCDIFEGKGGGKTRFTAKINKPSRRKEAEKYVMETLNLNYLAESLNLN